MIKIYRDRKTNSWVWPTQYLEVISLFSPEKFAKYKHELVTPNQRIKKSASISNLFWNCDACHTWYPVDRWPTISNSVNLWEISTYDYL